MKKSRPQTTTPRPAPKLSVSPAVIRADELYTWEELRKRLRWKRHSARQAQRLGLKPIRFGSRAYVTGEDVLDFFRKLSRQQTQEPNP